MKTPHKIWFIVLFAAIMLVAANPAFGRNSASASPQLTIRFAPSPGSFPEGVSGVRTGVFGFRIDEFPEPVPPAGYKFMGWFSDGMQMHGPIAAVRSTTILAGYAPVIDSETAPSFAIAYSPGQGQLPQGTPPIQSFTYGSAIASLPVPVRDGYYFAGWWFNGETITAPHIVRSDMTLEAAWSDTPLQPSSRPIAIPANHFVAAFNPFPGAFNGNEAGMRFGRAGTTIADLPTEPIRQGYSFYEWRLPDEASLDTSLVMNNDIMLVAVWEESTETSNAGAETTQSPPASVNNPLTSPTSISLMIFGAVILLGTAVAGLYNLSVKHTIAEGRYHTYITRCVREMKILIHTKNRKP